jgi:hypothetical protein
MAQGNVGDRVVVESERVGQAAREGEIVEVLGTASEVHYRVRWRDGHESYFFPSAGSLTVIHKRSKQGRSGRTVPKAADSEGRRRPVKAEMVKH